MIDRGLGGRQALGGDAGLHPDVRGDAGIEDPVPEVEREDTRRDLARGEGAHRAGDARPAVRLDVLERDAQKAQVAQHEVGTDERLLGGRPPDRALRPRCRLRRPPVGDREHAGNDFVEEGDPVAHAHQRPGPPVSLKIPRTAASIASREVAAEVAGVVWESVRVAAAVLMAASA